MMLCCTLQFPFAMYTSNRSKDPLIEISPERLSEPRFNSGTSIYWANRVAVDSELGIYICFVDLLDNASEASMRDLEKEEAKGLAL